MTSIFNFKNCFNGLTTEYAIRFLFIARFKYGFKRANFSKKSLFKGEIVKIMTFLGQNDLVRPIYVIFDFRKLF